MLLPPLSHPLPLPPLSQLLPIPVSLRSCNARYHWTYARIQVTKSMYARHKS
ncbi:uncharacterized protein CANTADRAFT_27136 [Suhomyces tanzawaensis NRRL Y-17324]|uniref:Uncharacterized protein n=1 Tax=Suhomyces tanzawaensis NRRL Y-17324 TaxID=984487 RepID=A0A1E4SCI5_9ASCO|nr:uncharacterized protein CANTADRAFT_27136 [Suhomyces tanzawaensis NRRL Y-17324]ODV77231.1 hypothetical protein CANTADRAFT_27136 [Suhomyces tanzawaensis NRRL Y-17324]